MDVANSSETKLHVVSQVAVKHEENTVGVKYLQNRKYSV